MTTTTLDLSAIGGGVDFPASGISALGLIKTWRSRARQRRDLAQLSIEQLEDIGISPEAAAAESAKRFWQA